MIGDRGGTSIGGEGTDGEEDEVGDVVRGLEIEEGDGKKTEASGLWPVGILDIEKQLQWDKMISTWNVEDDEQLQEKGAPSGDAIEEEKSTG
ncbi:hypothetical protein F0562_028824 [Nyssa sinensis]|uniref:Uncharacterized protein n=1 Tax=Nyssa sinensis TaxID=561372 RepID=A0A5J5B2A3_9ASTE|nr:hypothetical protein F0562_028824 [Nyssa sinensis]